VEQFIYIRAIHPDRTIDEVTQDVLEIAGVRFASPLVGSYLGFIARTTPSTEDLVETQSQLPGLLRQRGVTSYELATGLEPYQHPGNFQPLWPKRRSPTHCALVRIRVAPGQGHSVLEAVANLSTFQGAALVAGRYDLLLELGADDFETLRQSLLGELHEVQGIVWSDSGFAFVPPQEEGE
jgi:hypothetical protein